MVVIILIQYQSTYGIYMKSIASHDKTLLHHFGLMSGNRFVFLMESQCAISDFYAIIDIKSYKSIWGERKKTKKLSFSTTFSYLSQCTKNKMLLSSRKNWETTDWHYYISMIKVPITQVHVVRGHNQIILIQCRR